MPNRSHIIRWTQVTPDTFMYGSRLKFQDDGVVFENGLMPSGAVIHEWKMMTNFSADKTIPQLPILKHGQSYRLVLNYDVEPAGGVYFRLAFKKSNGSEIDTVIIQSDEVVFTYPTDAFSYEIQMLNAAATHVHFHSIHMIEAVESTVSETLMISKILQEQEDELSVNVILVAADGLARDVGRTLANVILVEGWQRDDIDKIVHVLAPLQQGYRLNFIGYTVETNAMAYQLAECMTETAWVTSDEEFTRKSHVKVAVYGQDVRHQPELALVAPLLHPSYQLNTLNSVQLNGGVRQ